MSESDPTIAELLTAVNAAILSLVSRRVQKYRVGEIEYTYNDLDQLRQMRAELQKENALANQTTTRPRILLADISGRPS